METEKNFPDVIPLESRYKDVINQLRRVDGNYYKLETSESTVRVGYGYDYEEIVTLDPMGGPMLNVGDKFDDLTINSIHHSKRYKGFLLEMV